MIISGSMIFVSCFGTMKNIERVPFGDVKGYHLGTERQGDGSIEKDKETVLLS